MDVGLAYYGVVPTLYTIDIDIHDDVFCIRSMYMYIYLYPSMYIHVCT